MSDLGNVGAEKYLEGPYSLGDTGPKVPYTPTITSFSRILRETINIPFLLPIWSVEEKRTPNVKCDWSATLTAVVKSLGAT